MLNCVPRVRAATSKYLINCADKLSTDVWANFISTPIYVHWPTIYETLKNSTLNYNKIACRILMAWENDKIIPIPHSDNDNELSSIVRLNDRFPDNVKVLCYTFGEYVELRKNFGKEDIGGFSLNDV